MKAAAKPKIVVGADVLDIMSIAMYAEPLVIFRELVQNAADSIDLAVSTGKMMPGKGRVDVSFDPITRTVAVLDNGLGLDNETFEAQMLSFGASVKRTEHYRGFRGIGRLAGLGHCKELVFRSRASGDRLIREARWSSIRARELIAQHEIVPLEALANEVVTLREYAPTKEPNAFFEVRLEGVRRVADDRLFDQRKIASYLSEVAPVPFADEFTYGREIRDALLRRAPLLELELSVGGAIVTKPYRDEIEVRAGRAARISEIEFVELPSVDDHTAAYGWIAHHDYLGALKGDSPGRGLRVRSGNLQIGDHTLLAKAFPEERFNGWAIGELHVFDARLRANARRDAFEPSAHVDNLYNQLAPYAAGIAKRCRQQSKSRTEVRHTNSLSATLDAVEGALGKRASALAVAIRRSFGEAAETQLEALRSSGSIEWTEELREIEKRAKSLARRSTSKTLSPKDRGVLDALEWLYSRGETRLVVAAISNFVK